MEATRVVDQACSIPNFNLGTLFPIKVLSFCLNIQVDEFARSHFECLDCRLISYILSRQILFTVSAILYRVEFKKSIFMKNMKLIKTKSSGRENSKDLQPWISRTSLTLL